MMYQWYKNSIRGGVESKFINLTYTTSFDAINNLNFIADSKRICNG